MRQYFSRAKKTACVFPRHPRPGVSAAQDGARKRPFGTQEDVYRDGYEWMHHSVRQSYSGGEKFRITIGGPDCTKPYSASVFNISAMSFGALSPNAYAR